MSTIDEMREKEQHALACAQKALSDLQCKEETRLAIRATTQALDAQTEARRVASAAAKITTMQAKVRDRMYRLEMLDSAGNPEKMDEIREKYGKSR